MRMLFILFAFVAVTAIIWLRENNSELYFALSLAATLCAAYIIGPVFWMKIERIRSGE